MSNPRNLLSEDALAATEARALRGIQNHESKEQPSRRVLTQNHFDVGAILAVREQWTQAREHLASAASFGVQLLENPPVRPDHQTLYPINMQRIAGLTAAFGTPELRARLGEISRERWAQDQTPLYKSMADPLDFLVTYLARGTLHRESAQAMLAQQQAPSASRMAKQWYGPMLSAILAIEDADVDALTAALQTMLGYHEYEALHGDNRYQADGLIAVVPLGLVQLSRERSLFCDPRSPYVPLSLLDN